MITIPLFVILFIYLMYLVVIGLFTYVNFSHLLHNGALTAVSFTVTLLVAIFAAIILFTTFTNLVEVDWKQPLTLWNNDWISNTLNLSNF